MSATAYERFRALHEAPETFVMPNAWDGTSAALLGRAGFAALGSTSAGIAFGLGRRDGRHEASREEAIANAALLARASGLPINGDLEDGFGPGPDDCVATVGAAIEAGLAGVGIEDTTADPDDPIHPFDAAVARVRASAGAARGRIVLTGRTDVLLTGRGDVDEVIRRLTAFAEAGADVLYAPGIRDPGEIAAIVRAVAPRPVNVLVMPGGPTRVEELAALGVRRISVGGALYRRALHALDDAARALHAGDLTAAASPLTGREIESLFPRW